MRKSDLFPVHIGWRLLLRDVGINATRVLQRAGLPHDLFIRENAVVSTEEYFQIWRALEEEAGDPLLSLRIGQSLSVEWFDPPLFAAICSRNLAMALMRIQRYKRLIGPVELHVDSGTESTRLEISFPRASSVPPLSLAIAELVFYVQLARLATRTHVCPSKVVAPRLPDPVADYERYFGRSMQQGKTLMLAFPKAEATRPFLTANEGMWEFFEPELQKRLGMLSGTATTAQRVRGALFELLPAGESSMLAVASKMGTSTRTLQRRLADEQRSFQQLLNETREELARHYLKTTKLSGSEISFLIGFEQPSSFFRAFNEWTGQTPEQVRISVRG